MAYNPTNLSALNYANGFSLWHYRTGDAGAEVAEVGYFNSASRILRAGDFIFVNAGDGSATMVVTGSAHGAVELGVMASCPSVEPAKE